MTSRGMAGDRKRSFMLVPLGCRMKECEILRLEAPSGVIGPPARVILVAGPPQTETAVRLNQKVRLR
jgi:hypothetical protein